MAKKRNGGTSVPTMKAAAPKRRRKDKGGALVAADRPNKGSGGAVADEGLTVSLAPDQDLAPHVDEISGTLVIPHSDGSIIIDTNPFVEDEEEAARSSNFDGNLALKLDDGVLQAISMELLDGIAADEGSREQEMAFRAKGVDLLALKVEDPKAGVGQTSTAVEGQSSVRDPVMLEAVLRFQANAQGELLPAAGPVKVVDYGEADSLDDMLAENLEKDLNYYLTTTASEYYPDTRRMFFSTGFSGIGFKKVYRCPLRRRPVSESVDASDLIVEEAITDLRNAGRITHQVSMRKSVLKRMQIIGEYRDCELTQPQPEPNQVKEKVAKVQGIEAKKQREQDQNYTIYECYCELDIDGYNHKHKGKVTGLPLPYKVVIDKDSRQILQIQRNWREDDEDFTAKIPFVAYTYATGLGFYGIGLLHILGNMTQALTALTREAIDAGMFASFPGFLIAKSAQRQQTNEYRIPPGGGLPIETDGKPIGQMVSYLPYKEAGPGHMALIEQTRMVAKQLGGTADTPVGEGKQDAPVGTTLALIEQATKVEGAVHKSMHASQSQEFKLLLDLLAEDPEALWRGNKRAAMGKDKDQRLALFKAALERCEITPKADPNVPSHMHRVMKATAIKQLAMASPGLYNMQVVDTRILAMISVDNPAELFQQQMPQQPDPMAQAKLADVNLKGQALQLKAKDQQLQAVKTGLDAQDKQQDRASRENTEKMKVAATLAVHPEAQGIVNNEITRLDPKIGGGLGSAFSGGPLPIDQPGILPMRPAVNRSMPPRPLPASSLPPMSGGP